MARRLVIHCFGPGSQCAANRWPTGITSRKRDGSFFGKTRNGSSMTPRPGGATVVGKDQGVPVHQDISEPCHQPTSASWGRNVGDKLLLPGWLACWPARLDPANSRLRICRVLAGLGDMRRRTKHPLRKGQDLPSDRSMKGRQGADRGGKTDGSLNHRPMVGLQVRGVAERSQSC